MSRLRRAARIVGLIAASPVTSLRVAGWTCSTVRRLRRDLGHDGLEATARLPCAPAASTEQHRGIVLGVLHLARANCLVRSAALQRWDADHGCPRALVIGVTSPTGAGFAAHAWLDGEATERFVELHRRPPP